MARWPLPTLYEFVWDLMPVAEVLAKSGNRNHPRVAVVIMGMHRSGTSVLARVLNLLGCQIPETLMDPSESNPRGHWESESIRQFNDELLEAVGSSWSDWTPVNPGFAKSPVYAAYRQRAVERLEAEFGNHPFVVLKDPRICRLGEFWIDALESAGLEPTIILPLRNPLEVAASLARRDGFDESYVQLLWLRHVLDAEIITRERRRVFTTYQELLDGWEALVARIGAELAIAWPRLSEQVAREIDGTIDGELKHHAETSRAVIANPGLSAWLRDTYAILENWVQNGERVHDYAKLDDIRAQLDVAAPAFAKLIHNGEKSRLRVHTLEEQVIQFEKSEQDIRVLETKLEELIGYKNMNLRLAEEQGRSNIVGLELETLQNRLADLEGALRQKQKETVQAWAEAAAERDVAAVSRERNARLEQQAEGKLDALQSRFADLESALTQKQKETLQAWAEVAAQREAAAASRERNDRLAQQAEVELETSQNRLADLENAFRQKQEEAAQAWAEAAAAHDAAAASCERNDLLEQQVEALSRSLADSESWVFRLAGERQKAERLDRDVQRLTREVSLLKSEAARQAVAVEYERQCFPMTIAKKEREAWTLRDALATTTSKADQQKYEHELVEARNAQRTAEDRASRAEADKNMQDRQLVDRFAEIAKLTRLYRDQEQQTAAQRGRLDWLARVHALMETTPRWWAIMPQRWSRQRELRRLQRRGLFNAGAYLVQNPDVSAAGIDPLRHYVLHGIAEARMGAEFHEQSVPERGASEVCK